MRPVFYLLAFAFGVWMVFAVRAFDGQPAQAEGEPTTTTDATTTVEVERTLQGRNVDEWHAVAARYLHRSRTLQHRIRYVIHAPVYGGSWLERAFLCVHAGEGAWSSNTGNGYHGGLQMDWSFMRSYGPEFLRAWGGAENWPASVQITVAIKAYLAGRGFHPWPNTARACGLIR